MKTFKSYLGEAIKGWKNAHSDIMRNRSAQASADNTVHLHLLKKDGKESGMHDARKSFSSEKEARDYHDKIKRLNPKRAISHNLYINNKLADKL